MNDAKEEYKHHYEDGGNNIRSRTESFDYDDIEKYLIGGKPNKKS
jgi:hypothetical protein